MEPGSSGPQGFSFRSILLHSLWTTLTGILFFSLATANTHNLIYIKFFAISGALLATLPWIIQLIASSAIILLNKTKTCDLMWVVKSSCKENNTKITNTSSPSSSSCQVLKETDVEEIEVRIVIGNDRKQLGGTGSSAASLGMLMEIEGRNNTKPKLLGNGSV